MEFITNPAAWLDFISQPWHWSVSGAAIALILFLLTWMGRKFGVSTIYENMCTMAGAGKVNKYFDVDLKDSAWRILFIIGAVIGGFISSEYLASPEPVAISESTISHLSEWGFDYPQGHGFLLTEVFNYGNMLGVVLTIIGGLLIGFGTRYGRGCTSGHAITGLSHLQLPSLLTVIGFFIGGLTMTWLIMPLIFG